MIARITKIILVAVLMTVSLSGFADGQSSGSSNPPANGSAVLRLQNRDPFTKRTPSRLSLEVIYEDGIVSITSDYYYYEGEFAISFENDETGATYEIPSIQIGESAQLTLEIGEYQLTAVAEDGTELIGFMQIY